MAGTQPMRTLYPFAEVFEVATTGTTAVDVWDIPAGTLITMVLAEVETAPTGDANNVTVGDDDDADGYILAGAACGATAGTIYGDSVQERGVYLVADGVIGIHGGYWKSYTSAGKEVKVVLSAAATTEATMRIYIFGYRYKV